MTTSLLNKDCLILLRSGFRYKGRVHSQDSTTLTIHDDKTDKDVIITISDISAIEVGE